MILARLEQTHIRGILEVKPKRHVSYGRNVNSWQSLFHVPIRPLPDDGGEKHARSPVFPSDFPFVFTVS